MGRLDCSGKRTGGRPGQARPIQAGAEPDKINDRIAPLRTHGERLPHVQICRSLRIGVDAAVGSHCERAEVVDEAPCVDRAAARLGQRAPDRQNAYDGLAGVDDLGGRRLGVRPLGDGRRVGAVDGAAHADRQALSKKASSRSIARR